MTCFHYDQTGWFTLLDGTKATVKNGDYTLVRKLDNAVIQVQALGGWFWTLDGQRLEVGDYEFEVPNDP